VFATATFSAPPIKATRVVIEKSKRIMKLYAGNTELASFEVSLGRTPTGAKECEGDNKTPEGVFHVTEHKENSAYYRSLRLSYPEQKNIEIAKTIGCKPGSDIMIHGIKNGLGWLGRWHRLLNWTKGCIALTNEEIEKVWNLVPNGTPVEIKT
jgi:murein L,D-transpeptidase YafK